MSDKNKIQGYYNPKTKQNEYKPIIDDYTPVDYGTAEKNAPQQNQSLTVYVVIIVVLALFLFFLTLSIGNMMSTNEKLNKRIKELETYISSTEEQSTVSKTENVEETNPVANVITLIAGEYGEYGKDLTYNEKTDMPDKIIAYYIPEGTYKITNIGEYSAQVNVYSNKINIVDGWEEPADCLNHDLVDVNNSIYIAVPKHYHIEIEKPTQIKLEKVPDNTIVETVAPAKTTEVTTTTEPAPTFEYDVKYISHKVDYDRNGNPVLLITYEFTNNSDENASWIVKLHNKVFQTGVECGGIAFHDEITSQMQMNDIQPGITVTIVEGYPLYDDTSTVTLECGEFLADEPMFVMELELVE